jgi:hypothetical protein
MTTFSGIFILQLIVVSVLIPLAVFLPIFLLTLIIRKLCYKKKTQFRLPRLVKRALILIIIVSALSIFLISAYFFNKEAHKAVSLFRDSLGSCNGLTVSYDNRELGDRENYYTRDPNAIEKFCKAMTDSEFKLRSGFIPLTGDKMYINVIRDNARNLYFEMFVGGVELFGERFFLQYKSSDKNLFDKIYKITKDNFTLYKHEGEHEY